MRILTFFNGLAAGLALVATTVLAQETGGTAVSEEGFKKVVSTVPGAVSLEDGTTADLELEFFVSPNGEISTPQIAALQGVGPARRSGFCDPYCFERAGNPPRKICIVPEGCPGTGNGGGVTLSTPLLVSIETLRDDENAMIDLSIDLEQQGLEDSVRGLEATVPFSQ